MSAVVNQPDPEFRHAGVNDIDAIMAIELRVYPFPWTKRIFADCLRVGYCCELVQVDNEIVGYAVMSLGANEAHLLNICVEPEWQHQGIGRELLEHMLHIASTNEVDTVFLEVRPSNRKAVALYEKTGFNIIGTRKDYYPSKNGREDAIIFARAIIR